MYNAHKPTTYTKEYFDQGLSFNYYHIYTIASLPTFYFESFLYL